MMLKKHKKTCLSALMIALFIIVGSVFYVSAASSATVALSFGTLDSTKKITTVNASLAGLAEGKMMDYAQITIKSNTQDFDIVEDSLKQIGNTDKIVVQGVHSAEEDTITLTVEPIVADFEGLGNGTQLFSFNIENKSSEEIEAAEFRISVIFTYTDGTDSEADTTDEVAITYPEPEHTHTLEKVDAVSATTSSTGNIAYWVCEDCDKYFSDAAGASEITDKTSVIIPVVSEDETEKDETNKDETNKDETNKDETNKDETNKDETNKDETNKDETNKDETNKDESNKDETNKDQVNKDESNKDESNKDESDKDESNKDETNKDESNKDESNKNDTDSEDIGDKDTNDENTNSNAEPENNLIPIIVAVIVVGAVAAVVVFAVVRKRRS